MKNKRIINFTLVFVLILSLFNYLFTSVAFADEYSDWVSVGDNNSLSGVEGISTLYENPIFAIDEVARVQIENGGLDISDYDYIAQGCDIGARYGIELRFIPKDCICVRTQYTNTNVDKEYYNWTCYSYDGYQLVQEYFIGRSVVEVGNTSCYQAKYSREFDTPTSPESPFFLDYQCKWAPSEEYALKYFQTMDSSFLGNGDSVVIPEPRNVSCYFASGENAYYIYWEVYLNDFKYKENFSLDTVMNVSEGFYDLSNCFNVENSYVVVNTLNYKTVRYQCKIDVSFFENIETAGLCVEIFNRGTSLNTFKEYYSSSYELFINKDSEYYELGKKGDDFSTVYPVVDYVNGNPNYTGGNMPELELPEFDSSDVGGIGFLDNIFNGFGLLGDNGLLALIGSMFSFIPTPIFVGLSTFVFVAILIALFKMFVK